MSKLNEAAITSPSSPDALKNDKVEDKEAEEGDGREDEKEVSSVGGGSDNDKTISKCEDDSKEILRFTMLFNKCISDLDAKRNWRMNGEGIENAKNKYTMFFNKEVTIRSNADTTANKSGNCESELRQASRNNQNKASMSYHHKPSEREFPRPQISEPEMMFPSYLNGFDRTPKTASESKKGSIFLSKRSQKIESDSLVQLNAHPANLRIYNSLTCLPRSNKLGLRNTLKSKIPSLTAIDANAMAPKIGFNRLSYWEHLDDLILMQNDSDKKRLSLQISKSSNDNNHRSGIRLKKDDVASVSDSRLLSADPETKKHIKKYDKKSRGDSPRKERESGNRKQVQWKTEVDVIYFSTHLAANGDRSGEVIGRVMEPLREEWEQQRSSFYVPYHMESHLKDRFISLLKI